MGIDLFSSLRAAAPLGGGIVVVLAALSLAAQTISSRYKYRAKLIRAAQPRELPALLGDEIDKLKISAANLSRRDQATFVLKLLEQRESRARQVFIFAIVIAVLLTAITIVAMIHSPIKTPSPSAGSAIPAVSSGIHTQDASPTAVISKGNAKAPEYSAGFAAIAVGGAHTLATAEDQLIAIRRRLADSEGTEWLPHLSIEKGNAGAHEPDFVVLAKDVLPARIDAFCVWINATGWEDLAMNCARRIPARNTVPSASPQGVRIITNEPVPNSLRPSLIMSAGASCSTVTLTTATAGVVPKRTISCKCTTGVVKSTTEATHPTISDSDIPHLAAVVATLAQQCAS